MAGVVKGVLMLFRRWLAGRLSLAVEYDLRNAMYAHLQRLSFGFFDTHQTGQLMSRASADLHEIQQLVVACDVDGELPDPLDVERDQTAEELLGGRRPRDRVVVEEEEAVRAEQNADGECLEEHRCQDLTPACPQRAQQPRADGMKGA